MATLSEQETADLGDVYDVLKRAATWHTGKQNRLLAEARDKVSGLLGAQTAPSAEFPSPSTTAAAPGSTPTVGASTGDSPAAPLTAPPGQPPA